uniref:DUF1618 domain-containing protein n=2 Tax=Setaria viridis TaxID=4556 RepID=A0A4U6TIH4_SETVI|nr:hypothetical protein SEVIR_9G475200v2 [Setaria viridis]
MIRRRFVNIVAENYKSGMCSLHRLDVSKHLFYPSTAEAAAAAGGGKAPQAPPIPTLQRLPPPCMSFPRPHTMGFFASEGRILRCSLAGHSLLYDADSDSIGTMPSSQGFTGITPKIISTGQPGALEEDLYVLHDDGFDVLRFGPEDRLVYRPMGRKAWHWESLQRPPFDNIIGSHSVVDGGRTICVSSSPDGFGTYCFHTVEREWWQGGCWVLPFVGGAEYVPEFKLWLGFFPTNPYHLCATRNLSVMEDLIAMEKPPTLHTLSDLDTPKNWSALRFKLLNLGGGRFCVAGVFEEIVGYTEDESDGFSELEAVRPEFAVLTGVELVTDSSSGDAKLEGFQIVSHKSVRYMFMEDRFKWEL